MNKKIMAAIEDGTKSERGRCLWCCEQVLRQLEDKLNKKLMSASEAHLIRVKLDIARALIVELRRAIVSGASPLLGKESVNGHSVDR